jgi:hypothetical protein
LSGLVLYWGRGRGGMRENHALAGVIAGPLVLQNVLSTISRRFKRSFDRVQLFEVKWE